MNLQQLMYFRTVATLEHYTRAAEQLNVSQSRLSHAIDELEKELKVTLFDRQGRNVRLTRSGAFLLECVSESLDSLDNGLEKLQDFVDPERGSIAIGYGSSLSHFMTHLITRFFEETGKTGMRFRFSQTVTSEIEDSLMDGTTDLAFTTPFEGNDRFSSILIGTHETVLAVPASHPLAKRDSVDLTKIEDETFITYSSECNMRGHINNILDSVGISPKIAFEALYDTIVLGLVAAGLGVALVPEAADAAGLAVKYLHVENDIPPREIHMTWVKDRYMTPAVDTFFQFVVSHGKILDDYMNGKEMKK